MTLIITTVVPATDVKGTRVRARSPHYAVSVTLPWDHSVDHQECHADAVRALLVKLNGNPDTVFRGPYVDYTLIGSAGGDKVGYAYYARTADELINPRPSYQV